jgi:predicted membrane metal-binding protein
VRTDHRNQVINAWLNGGYRLKHVHLCKRLETAFVVPVLLQQPVAFAVIGTLLAILAPVLGMLVLPVLLAVALVGPVIGISGQFGTLPLRFPGPLANLVGAETLGLDPGIRQKMTATMGTSTGAAHGSLLSEAINLAKPLQQEE